MEGRQHLSLGPAYLSVIRAHLLVIRAAFCRDMDVYVCEENKERLAAQLRCGR